MNEARSVLYLVHTVQNLRGKLNYNKDLWFFFIKIRIFQVVLLLLIGGPVAQLVEWLPSILEVPGSNSGCGNDASFDTLLTPIITLQWNGVESPMTKSNNLAEGKTQYRHLVSQPCRRRLSLGTDGPWFGLHYGHRQQLWQEEDWAGGTKQPLTKRPLDGASKIRLIEAEGPSNTNQCHLRNMAPPNQHHLMSDWDHPHTATPARSHSRKAGESSADAKDKRRGRQKKIIKKRKQKQNASF